MCKGLSTLPLVSFQYLVFSLLLLFFSNSRGKGASPSTSRKLQGWNLIGSTQIPFFEATTMSKE